MNWTNRNYNELIKYLKDNQDVKYQSFNKKLLKNDKIEVIGIRIPLLKKIAKYISKNDYQGFIKYNKHITYEECVLHGLVLGYLKLDENNIMELIKEFIPFIDNWATNDTTCSNLKIFQKISISRIDEFIYSENPWSIRFGLTLLLNYYIEEKNLDTIFKISDNIKNEDYYVEMANAWLLSICYIKYPEKTLRFLKKCHLNKFTLNKTISKICDSYRVDKESKERLKLLKVK